MRRLRSTMIYSAVHFLVDFSCAVFVLRFARDSGRWMEAVLIYNFCAFALQMPLGLLTDRCGNGRVFAALGCGLLALSPLMRGWPPTLCCAAGIGNALFHIGGGRDVLQTGGHRAGWLGVFVSPGALGLYVGSLVSGRIPAVWPVSAALALCALAMLALCERVPGAEVSLRGGGHGVRWLPLLFLVVCLRGYAGFMFRFPWREGAWAWAFVLCVVLGKTLGGWVYDRVGGPLTGAASLGLATALFCLSEQPWAGCLAVLLFNMTMPVTLRAAADCLPEARGFSFGLLTFALFLGFVPVWLSLEIPGGGLTYAGLSLASLLLLLPAVRRKSP